MNQLTQALTAEEIAASLTPAQRKVMAHEDFGYIAGRIPTLRALARFGLCELVRDDMGLAKLTVEGHKASYLVSPDAIDQLHGWARAKGDQQAV